MKFLFVFQAFGDAYKLVEPTQKAGEVMAPYIMQNVCGEDLVLKLDNMFMVIYDLCLNCFTCFARL